MLISRSRIALFSSALLAFALVACSSAPPDSPLQGEVNPSPASSKKKNTQQNNDDSEGDTTGTQTTQNGDLDPATPGDPAAPTPPGTPAPGTGQCGAQQSFDTCMQCCDQAAPGGFDVDAQAFGQCVCEAPGTCAAACGGSFCAGAQATPACEQCLEAATQCHTQAETVCNANAACNAAFACYDSSGCEAKP